MNVRKVISILLSLVILMPIAVCAVGGLPEVFAQENSTFVGSTLAMKTASGVAFRSYIGVSEGEVVSVGVFGAEKYDVYAFESNAGGNIMDIKKHPTETSMKGAEEDGVFSTWTVDPQSVPYQAYEVDVKGVEGNIVIGFQGTTEDRQGPLVMQIYNPRDGKYFEALKREHVNDIVSFSYEVDAQEYTENGRLRYRITLPEESSDRRIYLSDVSAGKVDKSIQYGETKTRKTTGNFILNYKGEISAGELFMVEAVGESGTAYSFPLPILKETQVTDPQLIHFCMTFGASQTERRFSWTTATDMPTFLQVIPYGPIEPDFSNATLYQGETIYFVHDNVHGKTFEKSYEHYVTVDDFELGKEYWFRYGDGESVWSAPCYLRIDDGDDEFSFVVGGDPQPMEVKDEERQAILDRYELFVDSINEGVRLVGAEFVMNCGDSVEIGNLEICWDCYFESLYPIYTNMTLAATMGNHDCGGYDIWRKKHNYPDNSGGIEEGYGSFYSFDYGNVHFTVVNGNLTEYNGRKEHRDAMLAWVEEDLSKTDKEFKIILTHQGMYSFPSHTYDKETEEMRPLMTALIDKYDVDVVFQGHDHVWIRTNTMENGKKVTNTNTLVDVLGGEEITYFVDPDGTTYTNPGTATASKFSGANPSSYSHIVSVACSSQPKLPTFSTVEVENGKLIIKGWVRDEDGGCSRISEYTCYGDTKEDGFAILKTSFYDKLAERINALPEEITLENKAEVIALKAICDRESELIIKNYIPDYEKVVSAAEKIEELERENAVPTITVNGDVPTQWETGKPLVLPAATAYDENDGRVEVSVSATCGDVILEITDGTCIFTVPGSYTLKYSATDADGHTVEKEYTVEVILGTKKGDLDADGEITVADALAALRIAAKLAQATENDILIGDIDLDGEITVSDALAILRVAAKMADSL